MLHNYYQMLKEYIFCVRQLFVAKMNWNLQRLVPSKLIFYKLIPLIYMKYEKSIL